MVVSMLNKLMLHYSFKKKFWKCADEFVGLEAK